MKVRIAIDCSNDAFQDGNARAEVVRILHDVIFGLNAGGESMPRAVTCYDVNGNTVGKLTTTGKAPQ